MSDSPTDPQEPAAAPPPPPFPSGMYGGGALPPPQMGSPSYPPPPGVPYGMPPQFPSMPPVQAGPMGHAFVPGKGWVLLATAGQRFGARLIDGFISVVVVFVVLFVFIGFGASFTAGTANSSSGTPAVFGGLSLAAVVIGFLSLAVFGILYEVAFIATRGATPGKMAMKIKVVDESSLEVIGWGPAFLRWGLPTVANFVCSILGLVIYLSFLWDSSRRMQGWHDRVAKDLVIQTG